MNNSFFESVVNDLSFNDGSEISITEIPFAGAMIVLLKHPASITVYKYVSVTVLSGSVSVLGYEITPESESLEIFSSEKTGLIEIKTETYDRIWKKKEYSLVLERKILDITNNRRKTEAILKNFENLTVAVFIQRIAYPANVQLLELYYPHVLDFTLHKYKKKDMIIVPKGKGVPLRFGEKVEDMASKISSSIRSIVVDEHNTPRILVYGPKRAGKSTLLRFLVNKTLSMYFGAIYLDTDPGQTEFGPPGTVSLTKITKPLTVPPFCHRKNPIKMIFTGSVSPSFLNSYSDSVSRLMDLYFEKCAKQPLFVNTMGWMEGSGLQCLINTIKAVKPTVLVEIVAEDEASMFDYREYIIQDCEYFQISCSHERSTPTHIPAPEMRDLKLISHLGKSMSEFFGPMLLNEMTPYCVSWDKIPIYIFPGGNVFPPRYVEAINQSIVALCSVPESEILESDIPEFPMTLQCEPRNDCLAYGLVTAVDEKEHLLYVVSPLKASEWSKVNAIIKGNVIVPDSLIMRQEIYDVPIPYTDERDIFPPDDTIGGEDDSAMVSLKYLHAAESSADQSTVSVTNYRKKISRKLRKYR